MFKKFKQLVQKQFQYLIDNSDRLYLTGVSRDSLWEVYLDSFTPENNPHYRERTQHDCNTCKQFIRPYGNVVGIVGGKTVSIWDLDMSQVPDEYKDTCEAMRNHVHSQPIDNIFLPEFQNLGTDTNHESREDGSVHTWDHFYFRVPKEMVHRGSIATAQGAARDQRNVFARSLNEISIDATETVLDLISQNSLYRGEEFQRGLKDFLKYQKQYKSVSSEDAPNYSWENAPKAGIARMRNTAIGTLLTDISEGRDLEEAVRAFEKIMAPANYKRPNAIFTKKMIANAQKKIKEMGMEDSLGRRYATIDDITINNVLFANRDAKKAMDVFDELAETVPDNPKKLGKVEEIGIDKFMSDVLPNVSEIEIMVENKHQGNMVSLIAPQQMDSKSMFQWNNNFSWSYENNLADSIKEKVKSAGGNVTGDFRASLAWYNHDDLDLHLVDPSGEHIYYSNKRSRSTGCNLDVDMNAGGRMSKTPVENIVFPSRNKMREGKYKLYVNNYTNRDSIDKGFEVEMEFDGEIYTFNYPKAQRESSNVTVCEFTYSHKEGIKITKSLDHQATSKEVWGIQTNKFQRVSALMHSPNHWDDQGVGNRHYFFMLEGCKNPGQPRGFFNEFLKGDLTEHRKVFEALGSKMKVAESDDQLSGVGFSTTKRSSVIARVKGNFTRTLKINF